MAALRNFNGLVSWRNAENSLQSVNVTILGRRLFERLPTGVRLTPLGAAAVELARGLLREIETAEEKIEAAVSGRAGRFRITATPVWMQAVLAPAIARYREALPGVELALRTAPFAEGLRLLENGESDLHCGGADPGRPLPAFLRRERFIELTAAIVAGDGHPLLTRRPSVRDLSGYPWIDYDAPAFTAPAAVSPGCRPGTAVPGDRPARDDTPARRRRRSPADGGRALARPAAAGVARPAGGAPAQAAVDPLRPAALPRRFHRPALGRGSRAVPGPGAGRARDRPGAERATARLGRNVLRETGCGFAILRLPQADCRVLRIPAHLPARQGVSDSSFATETEMPAMPPRSRRSRAVARNRARQIAGLKASKSRLVTAGIEISGSLCRSGNRMGLQQDANPRVSLAAADLSTRT